MIYLVRHGETTFNAEGRMQGHMDVDLSELGILQAKRLSEFLKNKPFDIVYSSPLTRAYQTALAYQKLTGSKINLDDHLKEIYLGEWEGKTWKDVKEAYEEFFTQTIYKKHEHNVHGGESLLAFQKRVVLHMIELAKKHPHDNVLIFTHGGNIRMLLFHIQNIELEYAFDLKIDNASITTISWDEKEEKFFIHKINDDAHLKE